MCKKCSRCGEPFEDELDIRVINIGASNGEKVCTELICVSCLEGMEARGHAIRCEACGEIWNTNALQDEKLDDEHTFTACPSCGADVVKGLTREQILDDIAPLRYAAIVGFADGRDRGFLVHAKDRCDAIKKVLDAMTERGGSCGIASVSVSEILVVGDEIR